MVRLTRAEQQARTRASVLAAARQEFIESGYAPAKIDRIAERAELTRGAVYSNFPSKRALYLAVLVEQVEDSSTVELDDTPASLSEALGVFARTYLERLPLVEDTASGGRLQLRSLIGVTDDEQGRTVLMQLVSLEALLLAVGLERCMSSDARPRRVRLAELVLTLLGGSGVLAEIAPGFGDPFDRIRACEYLAGLDLTDSWAPSYLPYTQPEPCLDSWTPPTGLVDEISGSRIDLGANGLITVLGARRLASAEETIRSARAGEQVTVVAVTNDPAETGNLVRLRIRDFVGCLRHTFPADAWQHIRLVIDDGGYAAPAIGLTSVDDETEDAVRVHDGVIVARAHGRGSAHAVATVEAEHDAWSNQATA